jgi:hypothetical protein
MLKNFMDGAELDERRLSMSLEADSKESRVGKFHRHWLVYARCSLNGIPMSEKLATLDMNDISISTPGAANVSAGSLVRAFTSFLVFPLTIFNGMRKCSF